MAYLQLQDQQIPLPEGDAHIGAFDGADVRLPSGDPTLRAVVTVGAKGVVIRRGTPDALVLVNGVQVGLEPSPLLHGDRIEIAGHELRLGDDQKQGSTMFVSAADVAALVAGGSPKAPKKPTSATGGRLVSLVDGREYTVSDAGITFGREVGNDVVLESKEVSRKHATIKPGPDGYVIVDQSTNGVLVNGTRIQGSQVLGRGDVLKMGTDEFRFYADVVKAPAAAAAAPAPAPMAPATDSATVETTARTVPAAEPAPTPAPAPIETPTAAVPEPVADVAPAAAAAVVGAAAAAPAAEPAAPARGGGRTPLASLEIKTEGPLKGMKFDLHAALTNIGRGEHNDIAIRDESISDSHAKIQKRGDGWYVVDQGSTNGTYVGGRRVQGEQRLEGAPDLRFGNLKMTFRPAAQPVAEGGSTRAIAAVDVESLRRSQPAKPPAAASAPAAPAPEKKAGCAAVIAFIVTLAGTGAGLLALLLTTPG